MTYSSDTSRLSNAAENTARQAGYAAQQGMERVSETLGEARAHTGEALRSLAHGTEELAHRGMDVVRDKSLQVRDNTAHYIQDEPMKSMLIAAAVGATLMGLVAMFSRSPSNDSNRGYRSHR